MKAIVRTLLLAFSVLVLCLSSVARGQELTEENARAAVEKARTLVADAAEQSGETRDEMHAEARTEYDFALTYYEPRLSQIEDELRAMPQQLDVNTQAELIERRDMLRNDYIRTLFTIPILVFEKADTYSKDSPERTTTFQAAATSFADIAVRYRSFAAGVSARLWAGRSEYELGNYDEALNYFLDTLELPDTDPFLRGLRAHALHYSMLIWLDDTEPDYDEAIERGSEMIDSILENEESDPHWLAVRYQLALACKLKVENSPSLADSSRAELLELACAQAEAAAPFEHAHQEDCQTLLAQIDELKADAESE